ncbi:MAG: hypothetical protein HYV90_00010 [Candidatus Woesebacteria bacterium]|nr:MAG: hypothetical protein HYV90_00010 [Candidatus Woesebacteria bacterium]
MEVSKTTQEGLDRALKEWKEDPLSNKATDRFEQQIKFANDNGIELLLEVRMEDLQEKGKNSRPMDITVAIEHCSEYKDGIFTFRIPSEKSYLGLDTKHKNRLVAVRNYRDLGNVVQLRNKIGGAIGSFLPSEISSLKLK